MPHFIEVAGWKLHPHPVFEVLGFGVAIPLYFFLRRRGGRPSFPPATTAWLIAGCVLGASLGSRLLMLMQNEGGLTGGRSAVGALLGGWVGIEIVKRKERLRTPTGEFFVWPLALAMGIGRIGCFLTGLQDRTHGIASTLPWAVDFGDGIPRHPTQLYEILFVILLAIGISMFARHRPLHPSRPFLLYLGGYFAFRVFVDFLKPRELLSVHLDLSQWVCALALAWIVSGHPGYRLVALEEQMTPKTKKGASDQP